jgi:hypothetical protein
MSAWICLTKKRGQTPTLLASIQRFPGDQVPIPSQSAASDSFRKDFPPFSLFLFITLGPGKMMGYLRSQGSSR